MMVDEANDLVEIIDLIIKLLIIVSYEKLSLEDQRN